MKYIPLHKCRICKNLSESEYGYYSVSSSGSSRPLPIEVNRLKPIEELGSTDQKKHHIKQCPLCGVFYAYDEHYEYDVTGSADELMLTRLTPTEAKDLMNAREYKRRLRHLEEELASTHLVTRRYAAKGLTSHYLDQGYVEKVIRLLDSYDEDVGLAVLKYLDKITEQWWRLNNRHLIEQIARAAAKNETHKNNPLIRQIIWRCGLK